MSSGKWQPFNLSLNELMYDNGISSALTKEIPQSSKKPLDFKLLTCNKFVWFIEAAALPTTFSN